MFLDDNKRSERKAGIPVKKDNLFMEKWWKRLMKKINWVIVETEKIIRKTSFCLLRKQKKKKKEEKNNENAIKQIKKQEEKQKKNVWIPRMKTHKKLQ